jgi:phosphohistidine swiveling domain-containing protein
MQWYSFRKRKLPTINPFPHYFFLYNKKTIGSDFHWIHIIENGWQHALILKKHYDQTGKFLLNKLLEDKDFSKKRLKESNRIGNNYLDFCRKKIKKLEKYSKQELLEILNQFYNFYQQYSVVNIAPWIFLGDKLSEYLMKIVKEQNVFTTLSTPNRLTYTKEEELTVLDLVVEIKEKNISPTNKIKELVKKYFWMPFDYYGPEIWNEEDYRKRINDLLTFDLDVLKKQKEMIFSYQSDLKKEQTELIKKIKLSPKTVNLFEALKDIATLQDDKRAVTIEAHYYLQKIYQELAKRTKLDYWDFYFLLEFEIEDVLMNSAKIDIKKRKELSLTIIEKEKIRILTGEKVKKYAQENNFLLISQESEKDVKELKGTVGSSGKVTGKVRIIESTKEMSKFKEGEILVAPMTTPDFVPIMNKAKAIITNEGGITCHAAILSRELKIPCVIGTNNATQVLQDGDLVEVDAEEGIVKILKK